MELYLREINSMEERYLLIEHVPEEECFEEEMVLYNAIPGLLPMETGMMSGEKYHRYRISGMQSLTKYLSGRRISGEEFERLFTGMFEEIRQAKEYLLREDGFLITPETIYVEEKTGAIALCYYPEYRCPLVEQIRELSTWLLNFLDASDEKAVYSGYALHVLCHGDDCTFRSVARIMEEKPALPEVTGWDDAEIPEEKLPKRRGGIVFLSSTAFLIWIGVLLFWVFR